MLGQLHSQRTFPQSQFDHHPTTMKSSTQDKAEGTAKDLKGRAKETAGRTVGNPNLQDEGTADRVEGKVQKKTGDVKKVFGK